MALKVDETISGFRVGDRLEYRLTVKDGDDALMDDAGINVEFREPLGAVDNYVLADDELAHISTGLYDLVKDILVVGDWHFEFRLTSGQSWLIYVPVSGSVNVNSVGSVLSAYSSAYSSAYGV